MRRSIKHFWAAAFICFWVSAAAQAVLAEQWLTDISYAIKARLDTQEKKIFGEEKVRFKNESGKALKELYLHLKPNRLREQSVQARTMGSSFLDLIAPKGPADGSLLIQALKLDGRDYEIAKNAQLSDTILKLNLESPIEPGNYAELSVKFVLKIPNSLERLGYFRDNYYLSWWYPELAVLDKSGWHTDPFREPYQNFGSYSVELIVPEGIIVGATGGIPESEVLNGDGTKTLKFSAQNVHDFAWVADKRYKIDETEWEGIKIRSLYFPENEGVGKRTLQYAKDALGYFSKRFGKYPYPTFTAAQIYGIILGAMEYPQLIMNGNLLYKFPPSSTILDIVIAHEIGHQWFYGTLMNNQPDETWLDEGFAQYAMIAYAEDKYGREHNLADLKQIPQPWRDLFKSMIPDWRNGTMLPDYLEVAREGREEIVTTPINKIRPGHSARYYEKGGFTLFALEYLVGREAFDKILQEYVRRFQFKQVTTSDFEKVASEVSGQDLSWFFDQWLRSTKTLDYVFEGLKSEKTDGKYVNRVFVRQAGDMTMPVDVEITLSDKTKIRQRWENNEKFGVVTFINDLPAKSALIDPDEKLPDLDRANNAEHFPLNFSPLINHGSSTGYKEDEIILGLNWKVFENLSGDIAYSLGLAKVVYGFHYERPFSFMNQKQSYWAIDLTDHGHVSSSKLVFNVGFTKYPDRGVSLTQELSVQRFFDWRYNVPEDPGLSTGISMNYLLSFKNNNGTHTRFKLAYRQSMSAWGSDFAFSKLTMEAILKMRLAWQTTFNTRLFFGSNQGKEPQAPLFSLQNEGRFRIFSLSRDEMIILNNELRFPIPMLNWIDLFVVPFSIGGTLFANVAHVGIGVDAFRIEAGLGLRIGFYAQDTLLRIEYPFWVNTSKDHGQPEWRVSLGVSF